MEMRAVEDVAIGQDLTPPIPPIAAALHDSRRSSHCSACFSLLPPAPTFSPTTHHVPASFLRYCSPRCSSLDSPIHFSSAEFHLLRHSSAIPDTSDLCLSLRLLSRFHILGLVSENDGILDRIGGLMTNRAELLMMPESREDSVAHEVFEKIKEGARAMAAARRMLLNSELPFAGACDLEEAVLCLVLTNAVEVQDSAGCSVGVAVYGQSFSWINHGCSPNCSYRFSTIPGTISAMPWLMHPRK
ncbi:unnamed protein product [Cuscuta campestris]|uniref:SET domain-containing protein n=1 Tax=Cuscuta campestris TaxID=132261 RepID=A0A484M8X1_9ASTE|nr:unnamed protein product [Cuscuta campestris]